MKRIGWLLSKLGSRRKSVRPVRAAEFLEVRALMDATMPELMTEVFTTEVTDGETKPEVEPEVVEGEPIEFTIDMVKRTLTGDGGETPVEEVVPVTLELENPGVSEIAENFPIIRFHMRYDPIPECGLHRLEHPSRRRHFVFRKRSYLIVGRAKGKPSPSY